MRSIKETLNFLMNYGVLKTTTTPPNVVWEILQKQQTYNPKTKRCPLCLNEKLEIARYKGRNLLNKRYKIINKCHQWNKFALALFDSKDWIKFSVTAFERPCIRDHSFPKSGCCKSSWSQPSFGNQCFPVLVSLFGSHVYEIPVSPSLVGSQLRWN